MCENDADEHAAKIGTLGEVQHWRARLKHDVLPAIQCDGTHTYEPNTKDKRNTSNLGIERVQQVLPEASGEQYGDEECGSAATPNYEGYAVDVLARPALFLTKYSSILPIKSSDEMRTSNKFPLSSL